MSRQRDQNSMFLYDSTTNALVGVKQPDGSEQMFSFSGGALVGGMTINTQEFDDPDAANAWVKPAGAVWVYVTLCGGGQDGGNGAVYGCGLGGSAGRVADKMMPAAALPSSVPVVLGFNCAHQVPDQGAFSYFGVPDSANLFLSAGCAAGGPNGDNAGTDPQIAANGSMYALYGQGGNSETGIQSGMGGGPIGPGGGGAGGDSAGWPGDNYGGEGGRASIGGQSYYDPYRVPTGGGGTSGIAGTTGGMGGNGGYDSVTGFGHGAGGGGQGTAGAGGNGGFAVRGGGGGGGGKGTTAGGFGGQGGYGYCRVQTICFNT